MWIIVVCFVLSCGILLAESIFDIKQKKVHVLWAGVIAVSGLVQLWYQNTEKVGALLTKGIMCRDLQDMICGVLIGIFFLAISLLTEGKMGKGDSFYLIALGILLGFQKMVMLSTIALVLSAFFSIIILISKKGNKETRLPFLPFLTISFFLVWIV